MTNDRTEIADELHEAGAEFDAYDSFGFYDAGIKLHHITNTKLDASPSQAFYKLAELVDPTCHLEYREWIPSGADECDMSWEWHCSNCDFDLTETYEDLDIATPEELGLLYCPHCGARIIGTRSGRSNNSER